MTKEQLFIQLVDQLSSNKLFFGHATIDAEDEAMMIMMHVFNQDVDSILASGTENIDATDVEKCNLIVNNRFDSLKPMAYLLGQVNFCGLKFYIDERALVPRSPIAELILNEFKPWVNMEKVDSVLDLCTGSGCIGLSIGHYFKHVLVDIADISKKALTLAQKNISLHQLDKRIYCIESDLFERVTHHYDLIVTNPPYVSEEEYNQLPQEYKNEPKLGLVTPMNGLKIPVQILYHAPSFLNDEGVLFLEVGYSDELLNDAFPEIPIEWIDFLNGGQGVCVFSKKKLLEYRHYFKSFLESKNVI